MWSYLIIKWVCDRNLSKKNRFEIRYGDTIITDKIKKCNTFTFKNKCVTMGRR